MKGTVILRSQQISGQERKTVYTGLLLTRACTHTHTHTHIYVCIYIYIYIYICIYMYVCEVDRVSIYSGLSGPALETVALLWIFKEPIHY